MAEDQLAQALARITALESELAPLRNKAKEPAAAPFDVAGFQQKFAKEFVKEFTRDPNGMLSKMGAPVEHIRGLMIADALGDQAPPQLQALRQQGPMLNEMSIIRDNLQELSRRLEGIETERTRGSTRESFKTLSSDKAKYPHLADAIAANPALFDGELDGHKGDASTLADTLEARLSTLAKVYKAQPASAGNADTIAQGQNAKPALGSAQVDVPPIPKSELDAQALRDEIVRKFDSGAYERR